MDWNWFFSAVAQSTAAIVGIIGAFVFTKIVNNQSSYAAEVQRLHELMREGEGLRLEAQTRRFEWYNETTRERELARLDKLLRGEDGEWDNPASYYERLSFSAFDPEWEVREAIENRIESFYERQWDRDPFGADSVIVSQRLAEEAQHLWDLYRRAADHLVRVRAFENRISSQPYSSAAVRWSILAMGFLFLAGVIYPLGLLPHSGDTLDLTLMGLIPSVFSFRGGLLGLIALAFGLIGGWFLKVNERDLRFSQGLMRRLSEFSHIRDYSQHLATAFDNRPEYLGAKTLLQR